MKKLAFLLAAVMSLTMVFSSCGKQVANSSDVSSDDSVVTSDNSDNGDNSSDPMMENLTTTALQEYTKVRYPYYTLNDQEKARYEELMQTVTKYHHEVTFDKPLTFDEYFKIFALVYFQESQLFWMKGTYEQFTGTKQSIYLDYYCSPEDAKAKQTEIDAVVKKIKDSIPDNATTNDKLKIIHDYVILNNSFTKEGTYPQTVYGGLVEGKIQCEGYAKTVAYLCDRLGIENMIQTGLNEKKLSHAWNIVKVNGEWYNMDTTFDDPMGDLPDDYIKYNYFLVPDSDIYNKSHFKGDEYYKAPACTNTKDNYFVTNNLVADSKDAAMDMILEQMKKAADAKQRYVQIKMTSTDMLNDVNKELVDNGKIYEYIDEVNKNSKNKINITAAPALDNFINTIHITLNY